LGAQVKPVLCIWEDAGDLDDGPWVHRHEVKPSEPFIFHQIGYLHEITSEAVVLTSCVGVDQMGIRSRIPIGMVRSLVELKEGSPVKIPKKRRTK
jgi:hypothetical protein